MHFWFLRCADFSQIDPVWTNVPLSTRIIYWNIGCHVGIQEMWPSSMWQLQISWQMVPKQWEVHSKLKQLRFITCKNNTHSYIITAAREIKEHTPSNQWFFTKTSWSELEDIVGDKVETVFRFYPFYQQIWYHFVHLIQNLHTKKQLNDLWTLL